jgi:hypothetical protein
MSKLWSRVSARPWRRIRAHVLARDGYRCRAHNDGWCAKAARSTPHQCTGRAELYGPHSGHAHHTRGKAYGDDPRFIVAACQACNLHIGDPAKGADPTPKPVTRW